MDTKVTTVIMNATSQGLVLKAGNRQCYAKLTSVKRSGEYRMHIDVNWTYQEFVVQDKSQQQQQVANKQLMLSSDDCCDYERITIKEKADGTLHMLTQLRSSSAVDDDDDKIAAHSKLGNVMSSWKASCSSICKTCFAIH